MKDRNGGVVNITVENIDRDILFYVFIDVKDSMGANTVNTVLEGLSPLI